MLTKIIHHRPRSTPLQKNIYEFFNNLLGSFNAGGVGSSPPVLRTLDVESEKGYAVLRGNTPNLKLSSYFVARNGKSRAAGQLHSHSDALSISLWLGGNQLVMDPGYTQYRMSEPLEKISAHSTVAFQYSGIEDSPSRADGSPPVQDAWFSNSGSLDNYSYVEAREKQSYSIALYNVGLLDILYDNAEVLSSRVTMEFQPDNYFCAETRRTVLLVNGRYMLVQDYCPSPYSSSFIQGNNGNSSDSADATSSSTISANGDCSSVEWKIPNSGGIGLMSFVVGSPGTTNSIIASPHAVDKSTIGYHAAQKSSCSSIYWTKLTTLIPEDGASPNPQITSKALASDNFQIVVVDGSSTPYGRIDYIFSQRDTLSPVVVPANYQGSGLSEISTDANLVILSRLAGDFKYDIFIKGGSYLLYDGIELYRSSGSNVAQAACIHARYYKGSVSLGTSISLNNDEIAAIGSGTTITFPPGASLSVPSSARLCVAGTSQAPVLLTCQYSYSSWSGISLSGAGNSYLQNCNIAFANYPITASYCQNLSISGCQITNSSFGNDAAMRFYYSSPTVTGCVITGQPYSANGVRFASASGGTLSGCTIQNCGAGNGIVIQANSSPVIYENTITNNYFHGIIVVGNGTGNPTIVGNTVTGLSNGSKPYNGIDFNGSTGKIGNNAVSLANYGIYCEWSASPSTYWQGAYGALVGGNTVTGNRYGLVAYGNSYLMFGSAVVAKQAYYGICNNIYGNDYYDAVASSSSGIAAEFNWWGTNPRYYADGNSYVDYNYAESGPNNCPTGGGVLASVVGSIGTSGSNSHVDPQTLLAQALEERENGRYAEAKKLYRAVLSDASAAKDHQRAVTLLYNLFQVSGDTTIVDDLEHESGASELLACAYAALGRSSDAETIAKKLETEHSGEEIERHALITQASLSAFDKKYAEQSKAAFSRLVKKYGKSVDAGLLAALGTDGDNTMRKIGNPEADKDSTAKPASITLENYPNPFNPSTVISYQLPLTSHVSLKIFDILGREVATLVDGQMEAGYHTASFDGSQFASGLYFARLSVTPARGEAFVQTIKMQLVK